MTVDLVEAAEDALRKTLSALERLQDATEDHAQLRAIINQGATGHAIVRARTVLGAIERTKNNLTAELERAASLLEVSNQELLLLAGEMTAEELRTTQAILKNRAQAIRRLKPAAERIIEDRQVDATPPHKRGGIGAKSRKEGHQ